MKRNSTDIHDHRDDLERAVAEVLAEPVDERWVSAAAARVWKNLAAPSAVPSALLATAPSAPTAAIGEPPVQGCQTFGHQIAPYLRGELAPARALLLEDHVRECLPCRRALHAARQDRAGRTPVALHAVIDTVPDSSPSAATAGTAGTAGTAAAAAARRRATGRLGEPGWRGESSTAFRRPWRSRRLLLLAAAVVLVAGAGLAMVLLRELGFGTGGAAGARMARVEAVDGGLYRVAGASSVKVAAGDAVREGERVRTAKGSHAVLRMNDGSRIEMAERAGVALTSGRGGNTIDLERGRIIVQAAHQRPRHLYVSTPDCQVAVTGTIFAVNHGTRGSRVSVIQGEVEVQPLNLVLHAGGQATTRPSLAAVPVRQEVAWSRDAAQYDELLAELTAAGRAIDSQVARPAVRNASRLLDLVPAGSVVYVALPNLSANLAQTQQLLEQRLAASPVLQQWWSRTLGSPASEQLFHDLIQETADVGRYLGDEVVVAAGALGSKTSAGQPAAADSGPPVLLAEVTQEAQLRATLTQEIATVNRRAGRTALTLLSQLPAPSAAGTPAASPSAATSSAAVLVWVGQGLLVASPSAAQIAAVAANLQPGAVNGFVASSFHARLVQAYADGAGTLFGADLQQLMAGIAARHAATSAGSGLTEAMGLFDLQHFVLERHDGAGATPAAAGATPTAGTETRAVLTFSQPRRGIASWLAAPAPMGSLGFFSSDANMVAAFVVKSPVELLDELLSLAPDLAADLAKAEAEQGFNLRDDLAAPLGGEIALGLDGPLLPNPSWQLVVEVYDPVRLQQTFTQAVARTNTRLVAAGKPGVQMQQQEDGGRTYYTITCGGSPIEIHYLFADGYLVAAPTRAQLDRALAQRAAGTSLAASARLRGLLGRDGQVNVSALYYQNLQPLADLAADLAPQPGSAGGAPGIGSMLLRGARGPSLLYAYAEADRIVFAGRNDAGPMGLNLETLTGFGAILGGMGKAHAASGQHEAAWTLPPATAAGAAPGTPAARRTPRPAHPMTTTARTARRSGGA